MPCGNFNKIRVMSMAWVAVNKDGSEVCSNNKPFRHHETVNELIEKFGKRYKHCLKKDNHWCNNFSNGYYSVLMIRTY
jgi:hypothetical protein